MPIYDFKCNNCQNTFNLLLPVNSKADCEECGQPAERLIGNSAFILNGGGWFKDGYTSKDTEQA